jgi:beta propeller repeat protein
MRDGRILAGMVFAFFISIGTTEAEWPKFRITTSPANQTYPDVSGNIVVWCDWRHSISGPLSYQTPCIYGADITDPQNPSEFIVSKQGKYEVFPQISGQYVAFNATIFDCVSYYDKNNIYVRDLEGTLKRITDVPCSPASYTDGCGTDGKYVVWQVDKRIKGYDIETDSLFDVPVSITDNSFKMFVVPDVSGGKIVWADFDNSVYNIHVFSVSKWKDYIVSSSTSWTTSPKIDGNVLVFNRSSDICAIDISDLQSPQEFKVSTGSSPAISGNIIVWVRNSDIYGYNLITHEEFCVISDSDVKTFPAIDGHTVVWVDGKNGQNDIYGTILYGSVVPYCFPYAPRRFKQ